MNHAKQSMKRVVIVSELYGVPEERDSFVWEDLWLYEGILFYLSLEE